MYTVRDRIPVGRDFPPVQTGPGANPASCKMGTGSSPRVKCGRGVLLTTHPLLVPRAWKSRAIPLTTLWATWWCIYYCPKHVEHIRSEIKEQVTSSWSFILREFYRFSQNWLLYKEVAYTLKCKKCKLITKLWPKKFWIFSDVEHRKRKDTLIWRRKL